MGRKLPWANVPTSTSTSRPTKRQKLDIVKPKSEPAIKKDPDEASFCGTLPSGHTERRSPRTRTRDGRSPSTSPPPAPPEIVFMREGINGDDVYMLVEDEFQTVAQSFTAHLHMAEYQRLKQEAKGRQTQRASVVIPSNASVEVKHKHARLDLAKRQDRVLKHAVGADEREDEEGLEGEVLEPWAGTSLAGLMKWDGSQKTSLKGLDRLSSGSRAAQGLGPNSERGRQSQSTQATLERETRKVSRQVKNEERTTKISKENITTAPVIWREERREEDHNQTNESKSKETIPDMKQRNGVSVNGRPQKAEKTASTTSKASEKDAKPRLRAERKLRNFLDNLDDFDEAAFARFKSDEKEGRDAHDTELGSRSPTKPQVRSENRAIAKEAATKKDRRSRYDEIPVFLV